MTVSVFARGLMAVAALSLGACAETVAQKDGKKTEVL